MAKPELGEKRICPECGTKYYDLNKDPIVCPKCSAVFVTEHETDKAAPEKEAEPAKSQTEEDETDVELDDGPEMISLEDAEDDDGDTVDGDDDDVPSDIPDVELDDDDDDDDDETFLDDDDDDDNFDDIIRKPDDDDDS